MIRWSGWQGITELVGKAKGNSVRLHRDFELVDKR